jgi:enoyl-CoA hydratase/carnithine racemase
MGLDVERDGDVLVATWRDGDNRINLDSLGALEAMCERVERTEGPIGLVLTGEGKFFSNGLDLDRFANDPTEFGATATHLHALLGRLMVLPAYAVAAINGHAFAGGAMLTCGFDHRVMREDRGYWCLNEAEIGLPLTEQMAACVMGRLPKASAMEAMLTARRYSGPEAKAAGIVEELAGEGEVLARAVDRAAMVATKDRRVIIEHKRIAFGAVAAACGWNPA